jgi:hypothetical protein
LYFRLSKRSLPDAERAADEPRKKAQNTMTTNDTSWLETVPASQMYQHLTHCISDARAESAKSLLNPERNENDFWMSDYRLWTQEDLIERIMELEAKSAAQEDALRATLHAKMTPRRTAR